MLLTVFEDPATSVDTTASNAHAKYHHWLAELSELSELDRTL
jgi:hypothetical protein